MIGFELKNSFSIKGCYRKICRLFPCIPILRSFFFFEKVSRDEGSGFYHDPVLNSCILYY